MPCDIQVECTFVCCEACKTISPALQAAHGGSAHILNPDGNIRDIYYARYIDWFFTTPLLLLDILLMADVSLGTALW